jgi:hypothetical protein
LNYGFSATGKNLCWYKTDGNGGNTLIWHTLFNDGSDSVNATEKTTGGCYTGAWTDGTGGGAWRMPTIAELGAITLVYNSLPSQPTSVSGTTSLMSNYWSSTELNIGTAFMWNFGNGYDCALYDGKGAAIKLVRCVRSF